MRRFVSQLLWATFNLKQHGWTAMWQDEMTALRRDIDSLDDELVDVLQRRFALTRKVGVLKRQHRQPPLDPSRGLLQLRTFIARAEQAGIDPATADALFRVIFDRVGKEHAVVPDESQEASA